MIGAQPSRRRIARQIAADHLADISEQAIARRSAERRQDDLQDGRQIPGDSKQGQDNT